MLLETHREAIETIVGRYASPRSAVLPLLYLAQDVYGHLSNTAIREVAAILALPETAVFEVVGFYTLFYSRPVGTWMLQVCDDVPCCYLGAEELITALKDSLQIKEEATSTDGMFTLQRVKCLAACDRAPVLQANLDYVYDVTPDKVEALLKDLRSRAADARRRGVSGRFAEDFAVTEQGAVELVARDAPYQSRQFEVQGPPPPPEPIPPPEVESGQDRAETRRASPL
ncbi:NAD(P)H-dependent oxidoreductase subunit E [Candidatus Chloroploca sp. M-50]|uniref:NAD(P)H-dependent oxidoreductase subunit E n=1 Tax=Candidatus Chloroploca mongolica TaxID=2528176 RepID=A0ABS4DCW6_9CHLR|nr:NAD(P)H-dependent oxidoreductase subunit E [Candidatus Chloroploca mongolica]MBP1467282.1 NAD(P)H-dependent oxidoreductase subunit E [Candidatus Chloroploca mongolica]